MLASGSGDTTVRFWDICTQTPLFTCTGKVWFLVLNSCFFPLHANDCLVLDYGLVN
jgi:WD40 repeat protein